LTPLHLVGVGLVVAVALLSLLLWWLIALYRRS